MRRSMATTLWRFSTTRMLHDYVEAMYLPAGEAARDVAAAAAGGNGTGGGRRRVANPAPRGRQHQGDAPGGDGGLAPGAAAAS
jgi:hypothetical protein